LSSSGSRRSSLCSCSAQEFRAPEIAKFNKIDANRDGTVSPAEIQAVTGKK